MQQECSVPHHKYFMQIPGIFRVKNVRSQYIYIYIALNTEHRQDSRGGARVYAKKEIIIVYLFLKAQPRPGGGEEGGFLQR